MASIKTQQYNILVRDGRDTRNFGSRCCKSIRRGNFTKTLASSTANGQETSRYSRCVQKYITHFIWLRQYLKLHVLAYIFCISKSAVAEEIYHVAPILFTNYRRFLKWHSNRQWNQFLDTFPSFPNAVGLIDGTIHRNHRPSGPLQADFYRGDKRCHSISSKIYVVVDTDSLIVLLFTGYIIHHLLWPKPVFAWITTTIVPYRSPGHMNDAQCYRRLPQIGHGRASDFPPRARILADGGYAARLSVIIPRRIARNRRQLQANRDSVKCGCGRRMRTADGGRRTDKNRKTKK